MKRFLIMGVISALAFTAHAQEGGFATSAPHVLILDHKTGIVLYEKDARRAIAPASMTKIMTAEMVFDRIQDGSISLDTEFTVSEEAWRRGGAASGSSTMFLKPRSKVRVEDLLRGVIIQSGNDACIVLAEGIAGSETAFADMMTQHARKIGLSSATFRNVTGWPDPGHEISLYDLGQLAQRSIEKYPEFYSIYAEKEFTWNGITQGNRNPLLNRFSGADGLKTGHTEASGYGLVASAKRGDTRRIMVVNGLGSKGERRSEGLRLMQAAFDQFKIQKIVEQNTSVAEVNVFMGKSDAVNAAPSEDVLIGLYRGHQKDMKITMRSAETIAAPIAQGDKIAELVVSTPDQAERIFPLYAVNDIKRKSGLSRAWAGLIKVIRG